MDRMDHSDTHLAKMPGSMAICAQNFEETLETLETLPACFNRLFRNRNGLCSRLRNNQLMGFQQVARRFGVYPRFSQLTKGLNLE